MFVRGQVVRYDYHMVQCQDEQGEKQQPSVNHKQCLSHVQKNCLTKGLRHELLNICIYNTARNAYSSVQDLAGHNCCLAEENCRNGDQEEKGTVIAQANAVPQPSTMVIEPKDTPVAERAML
jgi:hypothetical protein